MLRNKSFLWLFLFRCLFVGNLAFQRLEVGKPILTECPDDILARSHKVDCVHQLLLFFLCDHNKVVLLRLDCIRLKVLGRLFSLLRELFNCKQGLRLSDVRTHWNLGTHVESAKLVSGLLLPGHLMLTFVIDVWDSGSDNADGVLAHSRTFLTHALTIAAFNGFLGEYRLPQV
jgi:hypothetical protein